MIDTVTVAIQVKGLPRDRFEKHTKANRRSGEIGETWRIYGRPEVVYYVNEGWLNVSFSVAKGIGDLMRLPSIESCEFEIARVGSWLHEHFKPVELPSIWDWTVRRIDYCWMWEVAQADGLRYLQAFQALRLKRYKRVIHDDEGISWSSSYRNVKVYDKAFEQQRGRGLLRLEVSNYARSVHYMAERWFGSDVTLRSMAQAGRAAYVLSYWMSELGLGGEMVSGNIDSKLRDAFGTRFLQAKAMYQLINDYGAGACEYVNKYTYQRYKRELRPFMNDHRLVLNSLPIPVERLLIDENLTLYLPDDEKMLVRPNYDEKKDGRVCEITKFLKILPTAPDLPALRAIAQKYP